MNAYAPPAYTRLGVDAMQTEMAAPFTWHQSGTKPLTSTSMEAACLPMLG